MNQIMQGEIIKQHVQTSREAVISISFPMKGYGKVVNAMTFIKKLCEKSFLHDFQSVLISKVA